MVLKICLALGLVVGVFLVYVSFQPSEMIITRELVMNASPETIFPHINNNEKANSWMPWQEADPDAKMIFSGPAEGVDSKTSWDSKGKMGTGQAVIVESIPFKLVKTQLTYTRPMEMSQLAEISLSPDSGGGTLVRWSATAENSFISKIFCVFIDVDKMVGSDFEKGLATLKSKVETQD